MRSTAVCWMLMPLFQRTIKPSQCSSESYRTGAMVRLAVRLMGKKPSFGDSVSFPSVIRGICFSLVEGIRSVQSPLQEGWRDSERMELNTLWSYHIQVLAIVSEFFFFFFVNHLSLLSGSSLLASLLFKTWACTVSYIYSYGYSITVYLGSSSILCF